MIKFQKINRMTLKVYYDLLSQPSRALLMFLQVSKVPFEHRPIALAAGKKNFSIYLKK